MSDQIYFDDLGDFELIAFNSNMGVAANSKSNKLIIFERISREWIRSCYDLSDVSRIENISMSPKTLHGFGGGGLHGAGQSLGIGAINALHKSKAKRQSGIKIHLRSLSIPSKFLNVPMDQQRFEIIEALSQFLDGGSVSGQMYQVPPHVRRALGRPTEDEIRRDLKRQRAFALPPSKAVGLLGCSLLATILTLTVLWQQGAWEVGDVRYLRMLIGDMFGPTVSILVAWLAISYMTSSALSYLRGSS